MDPANESAQSTLRRSDKPRGRQQEADHEFELTRSLHADKVR